MIVKSQQLKGTFTHVVDEKYVESVLNGKFKGLGTPLYAFNKPRGLWLSWNKGWEKWCESESYSNTEHPVSLHAKLKPNLKVWLIDDISDFTKTWDRYCISQFGKRLSPMLINLVKDREHMKIITFWEWLKKNNYDAVALTNRGQVTTRMSTFMYGWDCASVVVFNPKNVILST